MDDEDDTANSPVEILLINVLSKVQQSSESVNKTCEEAIGKLRGSMGIRMPGVKRNLIRDLDKMIENLNTIKRFLELKTGYTKTKSGSVKLHLDEVLKKDPRKE